MAEKKTTVVLEAQAKGFEKAERQVQKTLDAMDPSEVMRGFAELAKKLDTVAKAFKGIDNSADFAKMTDGIREMTRAVGALSEARKKDREEGEREAKRHSFTTGLVQGSGVGDYVPPNLRMARYAAGQLTGRMARGGAGAGWGFTGGAAFQGAAGAAQGLAGIPVIGGVLSGQFSNLMGAAQEAMAYQETLYSLKPQQSFAQQRQYEQANTAEDARVAEVQKRLRKAQDRLLMKETFGGGPDLRGVADEDLSFRIMSPGEVKANQAMGVGTVISDEVDAMRANVRRLEKEAQRRVVSAPENPFQMLGRVGTAYGMDQNQAAQFGGQLLQAAGGGGAQLGGPRGENLATLALGLQGRFGVGPEATGMFMRGARTGGTTSGDAERTLMEAVKGGLSLGLEDSDLTSYMQDMASRIAQWDQTGMPVDVESAAQFSAAVAGTGLGGVQGSRVAGGLLGVGREIGGAGAQNAAQFLVMRKLFGYKGGGTEDYFKAMSAASRGDLSRGEGIQGLLGSLTQGKDKYANALQVQQFMRQVGVTISPDQALLMSGGDQATLKLVQDQLAQSTAAAMGYGAEDVRREGEAPGAVQGAAANRARRITAGTRAIPGMLEFEEAQTKMLKNASEFSTVIGALAKKASELSDLATPGAKQLATVLEELAARVGL